MLAFTVQKKLLSSVRTMHIMNSEKYTLLNHLQMDQMHLLTVSKSAAEDRISADFTTQSERKSWKSLDLETSINNIRITDSKQDTMKTPCYVQNEFH